MVEKHLSARWNGLLAIAIVASALLWAGQTANCQQSGAQDAGSQHAGIDPALLAKANAGDAAAQVAVGESYVASKGVAQNYKAAAEWYQKAADKGDIGGELHLAALYRDGGKGVPRDMTQAAVWYQKAAGQGDVTAQGTMGTLYSMGLGVEQNYVEAYYWLDLAAAVKGPKQAQYAANRQMIGMHITADELAAVQDREAAWKAAHPR
ncbi:MAG TPA: tetratricopeptide repeat protein [Terracidiphilus sp.]|nr:tetratricopeptide repeat protein [Terracidiphilus sp.]